MTNTWDFMSDADYAACVEAGRGPSDDFADAADWARKVAAEHTHVPPVPAMEPTDPTAPAASAESLRASRADHAHVALSAIIETMTGCTAHESLLVLDVLLDMRSLFEALWSAQAQR